MDRCHEQQGRLARPQELLDPRPIPRATRRYEERFDRRQEQPSPQHHHRRGYQHRRLQAATDVDRSYADSSLSFQCFVGRRRRVGDSRYDLCWLFAMHVKVAGRQQRVDGVRARERRRRVEYLVGRRLERQERFERLGRCQQILSRRRNSSIETSRDSADPKCSSNTLRAGDTIDTKSDKNDAVGDLPNARATCPTPTATRTMLWATSPTATATCRTSRDPNDGKNIYCSITVDDRASALSSCPTFPRSRYSDGFQLLKGAGTFRGPDV